MSHTRNTTPRYSHFVSARISPALIERLHRAAMAREERVSEFVRNAIRERLAVLERELERPR